jgi:hypothetical protein
MPTRRALIIGNPGENGAENYCKGVLKDIENYKSFLLSPQGGAWRMEEIITLERPSRQDVLLVLSSIKNFDYTYVVFSGHGYIQQRTYSHSTMLELGRGEEIDADELKQGANKRTIVLDCCREVYDIFGNKIALNEMALGAETRAFSTRNLDPEQCRFYYNKEIDSCSRGIVVQHSCSPGETSGDNDLYGGYYISSVLESASSWAQNLISSRDKGYYYKYTVVKSHIEATPKTQNKAGRKNKTQTAYIEKPRSDPYFPFAIVV